MVNNNKLQETMFKCVSKRGGCNGCFYGDGSEQPECIFKLMNDMLFFFGNPVPSDDAYVIPLEDLELTLADRKDHLAFAEYISSIHVATPVIRSVSMSGNVISMYDPVTGERNQFLKTEYYTNFRIWSTKPTDKLRNVTEWIPLDGHSESESTPEKASKTNDMLRYIGKMNSQTP